MKKYINIMDKATLTMVVFCALMLPCGILVPQAGTFLVFFWLIGFNWKTKWENIRSVPMVWLWVILAILYLAGYGWSENKGEAMISLEVKIGIFIFPLVFASMRFDAWKTRQILGAFLFGLIIVAAFMIGRAFVSEAANRWTYQEFSRGIMHPSYLSLYYVVGIILLFHGILLQNVPPKRKVIASAFVLFFCIVIFMLASKTGLISLIVVFLFYIGYAVVRFRRYVVAGVAFAVLVGGFFAALSIFPGVKERINNLVSTFSSDKPIDPKEVESNRVRLLIWKADKEIIAENLLTGVGTGDVQDELERKYDAKGMTGAKEKHLNAHNQFFQTGIALGLPGMVVLAGIFVAGFAICVRNRFGAGALFTALLVFNFIPESMLQIQAGTLFVGFFYSLVLFAADKNLLSPPNVSVSRTTNN